ncbi:MAG: hypothetical protein CMJ84_13040 [Planctomycetes bacterium]|nr:hypothetical protein [Planctomycetota bacterium]
MGVVDAGTQLPGLAESSTESEQVAAQESAPWARRSDGAAITAGTARGQRQTTVRKWVSLEEGLCVR